MRYSKSNISWEQAFKECADSINKHAYEMKITNELFPRKDGELWVNWIGLSQENRDKVYKQCYDTNTNKVG